MILGIASQVKVMFCDFAFNEEKIISLPLFGKSYELNWEDYESYAFNPKTDVHVLRFKNEKTVPFKKSRAGFRKFKSLAVRKCRSQMEKQYIADKGNRIGTGLKKLMDSVRVTAESPQNIIPVNKPKNDFDIKQSPGITDVPEINHLAEKLGLVIMVIGTLVLIGPISSSNSACVHYEKELPIPKKFVGKKIVSTQNIFFMMDKEPVFQCLEYLSTVDRGFRGTTARKKVDGDPRSNILNIGSEFQLVKIMEVGSRGLARAFNRPYRYLVFSGADGKLYLQEIVKLDVFNGGGWLVVELPEGSEPLKNSDFNF